MIVFLFVRTNSQIVGFFADGCDEDETSYSGYIIANGKIYDKRIYTREDICNNVVEVFDYFSATSRVARFLFSQPYPRITKDNKDICGVLFLVAQMEDGIYNDKDAIKFTRKEIIFEKTNFLMGQDWCKLFFSMELSQRTALMSKAYGIFSFICSNLFELEY